MNFKKFSGKVTAVAATMAVVAAMCAVSASAADYATIVYKDYDPKATIPDDKFVVSTSDVSELKKSPESTNSNSNAAGQGTGTILAAEAVSEAVNEAAEGESAVINMSTDAKGNITLREDTIAAIKQSNKPVTIVTKSNAGIDYAVTIDPAQVSDADGSVNVGIEVTKLNGNALIYDQVPASKNSVVIAAKGKLGMKVNVTVPASVLSGMNTGSLGIFAVDKNGKAVKLDASAIVVNDDGTFTVAIDGTYALVISDMDVVESANNYTGTTTKAVGAKPGSAKGVAALGLIDASAISAAAIIAKKKKKK